MATIAERILQEIRFRPLDDDQLARRLGVAQRQSFNQVARGLADQGRIRRYLGPDGKIVNDLSGAPDPTPDRSDEPVRIRTVKVAENDVKRAVKEYLEADGFVVAVAWGHERGIDIDARHPDGRRYVIEAKGGVSSGPQQVNYFLGALGELVQRMADENAVYGVALPFNQQYAGLVDRLPGLARQRLGLVVFWVLRNDNDGWRVEVDGP